MKKKKQEIVLEQGTNLLDTVIEETQKPKPKQKGWKTLFGTFEIHVNQDFIRGDSDYPFWFSNSEGNEIFAKEIEYDQSRLVASVSGCGCSKNGVHVEVTGELRYTK